MRGDENVDIFRAHLTRMQNSICLITRSKLISLQESIPLGCRVCPYPAPPAPNMDRMTDACENITFPQLCWLAVTYETVFIQQANVYLLIWYFVRIKGKGNRMECRILQSSDELIR